MNIRKMDLNLLILFDAIYTERNISRAAQRLDMSQSALSNGLARLRHLLHDPLFVRTGSGMLPTEKAINFAEPVQEALQLIQSGFQERDEFDFRHAERTFHLAMDDYSEMVLLPILIKTLQTAAPHIKLRVSCTAKETLWQQLNSGHLDLGVDYIVPHPKQLHHEALMEDSFVSIMSKHHKVLRDKQRISLKAFLDFPHITLLPRINSGLLWIDEALSKQGLERTIALQVPNLMSIPSIIANSEVYIHTPPARLAMLYQHHYDIRIFKTPLPSPSITLYQFWHPVKSRDQGVAWLRQVMREAAQTKTNPP